MTERDKRETEPKDLSLFHPFFLVWGRGATVQRQSMSVAGVEHVRIVQMSSRDENTKPLA